MRSGRRRNERGAALVEAAIIIPLVVLLTFGAIEYGFAFNEQGTIRATTRTAARSVASQPKATAAAFDAAAVNALRAGVGNLVNGVPLDVWVYQAVDLAPTDGRLERPATCTTNCRIYRWDGTTFTLRSGDAWDPNERNACAGASDSVGVYLEVRHDFLTGLPLTASLSNSVGMSANTIMALEPHPLSPCGTTP